MSRRVELAFAHAVAWIGLIVISGLFNRSGNAAGEMIACVWAIFHAVRAAVVMAAKPTTGSTKK